ncbi:MAG TPA: imidazoleglycerol-phosphate dehydratase HisB [Clostridia bacterium]|nr:imidazoleglycerol-phosphate dehydratase HisB [Clostridia bacterium]
MRTSQINRKTKETEISLMLSLDGGKISISTDIGFFDHMLNSFAVHARMGLVVDIKGDLEVDAHHSVEDCGIVLGKAFNEALGDKSGINRYGNFFVPMDESLAFVSVDVSGRPYLVFDADFNGDKVGEFDTCLCEEFFRAFAYNAGITLHIKLLYGSNAHHQIEAVFKSVAHALAVAVEKNGDEVLSTKGVL